MRIIHDHGTYLEVSTSTPGANVFIDKIDYAMLIHAGVKTLSCKFVRYTSGKVHSIRFGLNKRIYTLSRFILNYSGALQVDHINRNNLDNRRCNLRIVTARDNCNNRSTSSVLIGAYKTRTHAATGKWESSIRIGKQQKHLGTFNTQQEASTAYQNAIAALN